MPKKFHYEAETAGDPIIISKNDEIYQKGINEIRNMQIKEDEPKRDQENPKITKPNQDIPQSDMPRKGKKRKRKKNKQMPKKIHYEAETAGDPIIIFKNHEIYQKGINEIRNMQIKDEEPNANTFQVIIQNLGKTRKRKKKKYQFKEIPSDVNLTNESSCPIKEEYENLEDKWNKRRKKKKKFWRIYWKKMKDES
jgi:hypothetical protein